LVAVKNKNLSFQVILDVVEIDDAIIRVAKEQFGFITSDRSKVFHKDGIEFIESYGEFLFVFTSGVKCKRLYCFHSSSKVFSLKSLSNQHK